MLHQALSSLEPLSPIRRRAETPCAPTAAGSLGLAVVVLFLTLGLAACGRPGPPDTGSWRPIFDLAAGLSIAQIESETPRLDFDSAEHESSLTRGWASPTIGSTETTSVWSVGEDSEIEFFLIRPRDTEIRLRYRALEAPELGPQTVHFEVNGQTLESRDVSADWQVDSVSVPKALLVPGVNRLSLRYAWARAPRELGRSEDSRRLAIRLDWIEWHDENGWSGTPDREKPVRAVSDQMILSFGSQVRFFFELPAQAAIELSSLNSRGIAGTLEVWSQRDGEEDRKIATWREGESDLVAIVTGSRPDPNDEGQLYGLTLKALPHPEARSDRDGTSRPELVLSQPRLIGSSATQAAQNSVPGQPGDGSTDRITASNQRTASVHKPNLIVYMIDTLRADHLGCYGYPKPISPNIDRFASSATLFRNAVAVSSWTRPTVATMLTGLAPDVHRVETRRDALSLEVEYLPEMLSDAGYRSLAVVTNGNVAGQFGFNRGWDRFSRLQRGRATAWNVNRTALEWLDRAESADRQKPFFLYLHTIEPHSSYNPPTLFRKRFAPNVKLSEIGSRRWLKRLRAGGIPVNPQVIDDLLALYDAEIAANDAAFGELLAALDERGLTDNTLILLVSDHGEEFYEHGRWEHGQTLHAEVVDVPLIVRFPGQQQGLRPARQVDHLDVAPTLLAAAGLEVPATFEGRDLASFATDAVETNPLEDEHTTMSFLRLDGFGSRSLSQPQWRLIESDSIRSGRGTELFDRWNDSLESNDLADDRPVLAGFLKSRLRLRSNAISGNPLAGQPGEADLDDELIEELKALGYID